MAAWQSFIKPVLAGLLVTMAQVVIAVCLLAPEGSFSYRYSTLVQHDGYWFMNIVDRGYATTVPPIDHKVMEVSNVAFFPAYPALASLLHYGLRFEIDNALLVTAQAAAWGFWSYFFLFCERWNLSLLLRFLGALAIGAHPAAFFLIAAYSESLFLMALVGFIFWATQSGRTAKFLTLIHGIMMSATRIVGIPCAAFPVVQSVLDEGPSGLRRPVRWVRQHWKPIALMLGATGGAMLFFLYCQLRWGHWDIYMLTQSAGWSITPDYLAIFRPSSYRWLIPALNNPTEASQTAMSLGGLIFVVAAIGEGIAAIRKHTAWQTRVGIYFCAALVYYISVAGVACVDMESMLRYQFCAHALIVLAFLHFLRQFRSPPALVRTLGLAAAIVAGAAGLSIQGWYVWNFTRGNWVA